MNDVAKPERRTIVLSEYEEVHVSLTPAQIRRIRAASGDRIRVSPGEEPNHWFVRATQYVGTLITEDVELLVRPKVPVTNVLYLLEGESSPALFDRSTFGYGVDAELLSAFAALYARRLEESLAFGLAREYVVQEDALVAPRGRIDVARQARAGWAPIPISCRFDEYEVDTPLNRVLRAAAQRLLRIGSITTPTRRALLRCVERFDGVGSLRPSDIETPSHVTRLSERFRTPEALARLALEGASVRDDVGSVAANTFFLDMNKIFEQFVTHRLARLLPRPLQVERQCTLALDEDGRVLMIPDLVVRAGDQIIAVADAKYKVTSDGLGRNADYYQLLAYLTAFALPAGLLIYCQSDGEAPPQTVVVRHTRQLLHTHAVRLDGSIEKIEQEMERLAATVRDLSGSGRRVSVAA